LLLFVHLFEMQRKEGVYIDEMFTLMVCSGTYDQPKPVREGSSESGRELRSRLLNLENTGTHVQALREGTRDLMWTNVYYSFVQWVAGGKVLSSKEDVLAACRKLWVFNLLFLLLCVVMGWQFLRMCLLPSWAAGCCLLLMFGSASISMVVMLARGFMLAMLGVFCVSAAWVKVARDCRNGQCGRWKHIVPMIASMAFAMLAAYSNLIFVCFLMLGWILLSGKRNIGRTLSVVSLCLVCAFLLCLLIYPCFLDGFSEEGHVGTGRHFLSLFYPKNFLVKSAYLLWHLHKSVMLGCLAPVPIVVGVILWKKHALDESLLPIEYLCMSAWLTILLSWTVAPYRSMRYVVMFLPVAMMSWAWLLNKMDGKIAVKWKLSLLTASVLLVLACHGLNGSVELSCNPNPLKGKTTIHACSDKEMYFLQSAILPFAEDDAQIFYHDLSHCHTYSPSSPDEVCITTDEPTAPQGLTIHRFLKVIH